jgi:hypothetical protein
VLITLRAAVTARRSLIAVCALLAALGVAACGGTVAQLPGTPDHIQNVADANNNGDYVDAGGITYQLQISRELNQYSTEDSQYVKGLPAGVSADLTPTQLWYGVFLWAKNQSDQPLKTTDNFEMVDTQGNVYRPVQLDTALNPFAWTAQKLQHGSIEPKLGTIAANGATQGGLLLFKVSTNVYSNRPLTLYILGADNQRLGAISLDL